MRARRHQGDASASPTSPGRATRPGSRPDDAAASSSSFRVPSTSGPAATSTIAGSSSACARSAGRSWCTSSPAASRSSTTRRSQPRARSLEKMPADALPVIDGLACPPLPSLRWPQPWVALVHHPLALETGLGAAEAEALAAIERRALAAASRVIVTSPQTRRDLAGYDVETGRGSASCCPAPSPPRSPAARAAPGSPCSASPR